MPFTSAALRFFHLAHQLLMTSVSRGAAEECSPGRQTGVRETIQNSRRAPEGRQNRTADPPLLSPLRGSQSMMALSYPGLTPGATLRSPLRGYKTSR
jgi:hypothetical protein